MQRDEREAVASWLISHAVRVEYHENGIVLIFVMLLYLLSIIQTTISDNKPSYLLVFFPHLCALWDNSK